MVKDRYETPLTPPITPPVIDPEADPEAAAKTGEDPQEGGTTRGRRSDASKISEDNDGVSETLEQGRKLEGAGEDDLDEAGSPGKMLSD